MSLTHANGAPFSNQDACVSYGANGGLLGQTITFTSTNPSPVTIASPSYTPAATATSGLPVAITLDETSSGCSLTGGVVSFTGPGTCLIDANQVGNDTWATASQQQQTITVTEEDSVTLEYPNQSIAVFDHPGLGVGSNFIVGSGASSSGDLPLSIASVTYVTASSVITGVAGSSASDVETYMFYLGANEDAANLVASLSVNLSTGAYTFTQDAAALSLVTNTTFSFAVSVTDGSSSALGTLVLTITT